MRRGKSPSARLFVSLLFSGCTVALPAGQLECDGDADCPPGWVCDVNGDGTCYPDESDLSTDAEGDVDAGSDAGASAVPLRAVVTPADRRGSAG